MVTEGRSLATGIFFRPRSRARRITSGMVLGLVGRYFLYFILIVLFLMPFLWMFFGSVRRESEILGEMFPFTWHTIVPIEWTLKSFGDIYGLTPEGKNAGLHFQQGVLNSAIVSTG